MTSKIDKIELANKINSLDCLDNETKSQLLGLLNGQKRYGLIWEDKAEDAEENLRTKLPVLTEVKERSIISNDPTAPTHILIEGDNIEALTSLSYTHEEKIDLIYIDPPYNTGNKDFIYNDSFVDADDDYRHSKWISFMSKRLKTAKKLLKKNGLIWISIDENELFNLKLLADSIFSSQNFRSLITVVANPGGRDYGGIAKTTEYILVYAMSEESTIAKVPDENHVFDMEDEFGPFELRELRNRNIKFNDGNRPNLCYPFYVNPNDQDEFGLFSIALEPDDNYVIKVMPLKSQGIQTVWRWGKEERSRKNLNINIKAKKKNDGTFMIVEKYRDENVMIKNVWSDKKYRTEQGSLQIKEILGEKVFDYPKPLEIPELILQTGDKDATILDFFAGSGTTLHAVMRLNANDGGQRQCILVTNNENGICENVTYERNKRVITGYVNSKGEHIEGLSANTLRYYITAFVARESSLSAKKELMSSATELLCIKNNIYQEETSFGGKKFKKDILRFFAEGEKQMLIIYQPEAIPHVVDLIKEVNVDTPIIVYVFSANDYAMDADFEEVANKVSLCALPDAILRAYRRVLPKKKMEDQI